MLPYNTQQIVTDASGNTGCAYVTSTKAFQHLWQLTQHEWAIHVKELYAIKLAIE